MTEESIFNPDNSIYAEYFRLTDFYLKKYGPNTILLLQVGAFFEMYAAKDPVSGVIAKSRIEDFCTVCGGLAISEKKYTHGTQQIVMAGFRDYNVDRYIQTAVDSNFTVVVYTQKELAPGRMTREHTGTFSPGTFLPSDSDSTTKMTNNVLCLWLDVFPPSNIFAKRPPSHTTPNRSKIICGAAVVNIFTGQSSLFEYESPFEMVPATFDALERFVCTHSPSETIFITPFEKESDSNKVLQYIGVASRTIHLLSSQDSGVEIIERCRQQKYIRHVLSSFFREDTYDICNEFRNYVVGTQAYCYLLHFIQERNPNLVRKIALPQFDNKTTNMILANHTLRQLNIIDDGNSAADDADMSGSNLRSVSAFLNKCGSAVGRRRFVHQIVHPTFDVEWLNTEYDAISNLLLFPEMIDTFRKIVREVADLDKIGRQLVSRKLNPDSIARLYRSILAIQQIHVCLLSFSGESDLLCQYFVGCEDTEDQDPNPNKTVESWITLLLGFISTNLIVEKCEGCTSTTSFDDNIICYGVSAELDALLSRMEENEMLFQEIRRTFNSIMSKLDGSKTTEYVKVHDTEKTGSFLQLTKKRSTTLKKHLAELLKKDADAKIVFSLGASNIPVAVSDIQTISSGITNDTISFNLLDKIIREKITIRDTINTTISKAYSGFLDRLETYCLPTIERLSNFIAKVDVLQSKAYVAKIYGYCRPNIDGAGAENKSYVDAKGLRHVLIEHIQTQELYVVNDVCLSKAYQIDGEHKHYDGMLLYGTNAVGKTSLIRALGIAIIMAQSGMFVPCSALTYRPYRAIFSRILGNDNLFKNLSMFAVEMSELRVILNSADEYSMVLGDELCSGTETESALSIFVSGLTDLHEKRATFLFATHFHEVLKFDEVKVLTKVAVRHMAVHYDRENDCLVYDRVLREGAGNRLYGLEVAKSLHLPDEFIERAYSIRNKYFPDMCGSLSSQPSRYNSAKLRGKCELCREDVAEEIHHLQEQKLADENGRIGSIHKNHSANLMSLCEKCHLKMHQTQPTTTQYGKITPKIIRKKTTKGNLVLVETTRGVVN